MIARLALGAIALFISLCAAAAQGSYQIQSGDTLAIEILEDSSLNRNALVLPDGRFSFPMAGSVKAGGRTTDQVEQTIASSIASNFAVKPTVFVSVVGLAPEKPVELSDDTFVVYLVGEVNDPGPKTVLGGTTLLQLLSQSGGFTKYAAKKRLQLRRQDKASGRQKLYKINYKAIAQGAQINADPRLIEGDVVLVPERRLFE
ncbi:polysaccharide export outer membrane protein [Aliiruegeria haliotis]|uniref:Polysaccharide export outer membrane protein n=1 Tax=Aliiruegeria haliotis TaxID=1280846 RepID=A0A2T0RFA7_9RHOB|nr:polysaccharide biosynthesis/export family protein [Aliiruegeria haliotis]PRY19845.1 polysaccharide export outer membrane protein [Aliiruegeria haliotis]